MNNLFRGLIAGFGAKKLGGGCFSTIIVFIIIWVALGQCENTSFGERQKQKRENKKLAENRSHMQSKNLSGSEAFNSY